MYGRVVTNIRLCKGIQQFIHFGVMKVRCFLNVVQTLKFIILLEKFQRYNHVHSTKILSLKSVINFVG